MTTGQSTPQSETERWPTFELSYTFDPDGVGRRTRFESDEVVIYEPAGEEGTVAADRWLSAKRAGYLPIEELR